MSAEQIISSDLFAAGPRQSNKRILLFGDSHGMLLMHGLATLADEAGVRIDQATRYSTAPLLGFNHTSWNNNGAEDFCTSVYNLIDQGDYDCIVLSAAWHSYYRESPSFPEAFKKSMQRLQKTTIPICIVLPVPSQNIPLPQTLCATVRLGRNPSALGIELDKFEYDVSPLLSVMRERSGTEVTFVDPLPVMVDTERLIRCEFDGNSMYSDNFHLSHFGALKVAKHVFPTILRTSRFDIPSGSPSKRHMP
jgi:hypothetical protein